MAFIPSNGPYWRPIINEHRFSSYFIVAAMVAVMYDWALTFGQEVELIWGRHWSLMTVLYLSVRYLGILYVALNMLYSVLNISLPDRGCFIIYAVSNWTSVVAFAMLWVIIITRLHAMYQLSRKTLIFLIVTFLSVNIFRGVVVILMMMYTSGEELILSGTHMCSSLYVEEIVLLSSMTWILAFVWEVLALCHTVWAAVKHFRELRQHSAGRIVEDYFTMLIKTHMLYFASMVAASSLQLIIDFSTIFPKYSLRQNRQIDSGLLQIFKVMEMFLLGPRLILSIREYHVKLVADSNAATGMTSIAFKERMHASTSSGV